MADSKLCCVRACVRVGWAWVSRVVWGGLGRTERGRKARQNSPARRSTTSGSERLAGGCGAGRKVVCVCRGSVSGTHARARTRALARLVRSNDTGSAAGRAGTGRADEDRAGEGRDDKQAANQRVASLGSRRLGCELVYSTVRTALAARALVSRRGMSGRGEG